MMYACREIDTTFFDTAKRRFKATVEMSATPEKIFTIFEDAHAWTVWAPPITHVAWTSPRPYGVGTTRTVSMAGGLIGEEKFIAWQPGQRMSFRFTNTNIPTIAAFGEDYQLEPRGNGRTAVTWMMAMEGRGLAGDLPLALFGPVMGASLAWMLRRFGRYVESH
ncbi:MAG: hypothetical protein ACI8TX_001901 [Hyphomicrobiaceae bacterium]|jgi:hypothetical protein